MTEQELLARAVRAFQDQPLSTFTNRIKAIVGPPSKEYEGLASEAMAALQQGKKPSPKQIVALETVIRVMRPSLLSRNGELGDLDAELAPNFPEWSQFQKNIKPYLYSICRVDLYPEKAIGTGFLVASDVIATNKHVLDRLSYGTSELEEGQAVVRFRYEYDPPDKEVIPIVGVIAVHPDQDIALLKLKKDSVTPQRPLLEVDDTAVSVGHNVVALGYPLNDPLRNPLFIGPIFGDRFGVKRAAPGEIIGHSPKSIFHDCSTLGGNSGSPIFSMQSTKVIGIHREGAFLLRNGAADGATLKQFVQQNL